MTAPRTIPFARPWITDAEKSAVLEVLGGPVLTHGPQNHAFEHEFAAFMGGDAHCAAVSSCMAALHLTYFVLGVGPGDEVIVPAQTHVATAHAVEMVGARPVFVDCEPGTGNLDASLLPGLVTPRTKAISLVHFLGVPCDMDAVLNVARKHDLKVVEDCALAVGARYRGTHVGLLGDVGCFSFYPVKHITTGDGGMFVSRHKTMADKVAKARAFGVDRGHAERSLPGMYDVPTLGTNYRMSDINAAVGRQQLARVGTILERRRDNFTRLKAALAGIHDVRLLDAKSPDTANSFYCLSAVLLGPLAGKRDEIVRRLNAAGVGTSVYYPQPVPRMAYYRQKYGYRPGSYPNAEEISDCSIALPVGPHLTADDVDTIAGTFARTLEEVQ